jgi:hypothetical protein
VKKRTNLGVSTPKGLIVTTASLKVVRKSVAVTERPAMMLR